MKQIICILLLLSTTASFAFPYKKISIAIPDADGFPHIKKLVSKNDKNPGTYVEFIRLLEKKMNVEISIKRCPWKRCLVLLSEGKIAGVISASYKPKREKIGVYPKKDGKVDPSRRFESGDYYLFKHKNSKINWDGAKFTNLNGVIIAQLGFSIVSFLKKHGVNTMEVSTPQKAFELLDAGHAVAAAIHSTIGRILLEQYKDLEIVNPPLVSKPYYLLMSHQIYSSNPKFVEELWDRVGEIFYSPELKRINKKYLKIKKW